LPSQSRESDIRKPVIPAIYLSWIHPGILEYPTDIDRTLVAERPSRSKIKTAWRLFMPARNESTRAIARLRHVIEKQQKRARRALTILPVLSAMTLFAAPAIAQTDYDGIWTVTVITRTGSCQPTTSYPLVVTDGSVSGAADLSGSVGRNGMVRASLRGAHASGQLSGNAGSGRWNSASAGMPCSGQWMATRQ
jgi:hypothetical protein